ncbi:MAG: Rrf2 family transcriptional regulator [Nitratireductor sp.]
MKLTLQTDYALRILMTLAKTPERLFSVQELADSFSVSKNHLMKTAQHLTLHGFIKTERGRNGGIKLAMAPNEISIGNVVRLIEPNMHIAECFSKDSAGKACSLLPNCKLKSLLGSALVSFISVLDEKTLEDMTHNK